MLERAVLALACVGSALLLPVPSIAAAAKGANHAEHSHWVQPPERRPSGIEYRTFRSAVLGTEVGYSLYLPPEYWTKPEQRFPVVYWLHGRNGNPAKLGRVFARFDAAIRAGRSPQLIVVGCTGRAQSMWCDSRDGRQPVESILMRDLLPHIDATYRTVAAREGRAIEGFSMGGFGAARLGFKFPDSFCAVSILGAAMHDAAAFQRLRSDIFAEVFGDDAEYCRAQTPWTIVRQNASRLRGQQRVRLIVGEKDGLLAANERYHRLLQELDVPHAWAVAPGAGHSYTAVVDQLPFDAFAFFRDVFPTAPMLPQPASASRP